MARAKSKQKQLGNRKDPRRPRVQIEYDVEIGNAMEKKELAFVVGAMGDYVGDFRGKKEEMKPLEERRFIDINEENFDQVMQRLKPGLDFTVENTLAGDGSKIEVNLDFKSMEDFEPGRIVEQVEPLRKLLETRNMLRDLQTSAEKAQKAESLLEDILKDPDRLQTLASELGTGAAAKDTPGPADEADDTSDEGAE